MHRAASHSPALPFSRLHLAPISLSLAALLLALPARAAVSQGFRVPDGFEVSLYAGDELAHDIFSMTLDSKGRVVVASKDWIKILHDTDGDGRADKATVFLNGPKSGAHGMYFDGNDLICDGDNGVRRWFDRNGDGVADGESELFIRTERDGEHSANGIVKGPDGWFYMIGGNDTGITNSHASLPGSPVKQPNAGALVRIPPDGKGCEVVAHGFRNPYDLDFNAHGAVFTYDADGERDHHLPWYSGTRIFDISSGAHHGWILRGWQHAWNRPEAWFDNTDRLWEVGRGSPTGVTVYRHRAFPARYREGLFAICWTYGRIYYFPLTRRGSTYETKMEIFMETAGDNGFAPTDLAVAPNGDLFVSIGGRGTVGSVFRVRYTGKLPPTPKSASPLREVLQAPQPLASWSRAQWVPQAKTVGRDAFEKAALDAKLPQLERLRALEVLVEVFGGVTPLLAAQVADGTDAEVTARAVWALSRSKDSPESRDFLATMTRRDDPRIARAAWEAVLSLPSNLAATARPDWFRGLGSDDRRVRHATVLAASERGLDSFHTTAIPARLTDHQRLGLFKIYGPLRPDVRDWTGQYVRGCLFILARSPDTSARLDAARLLQLALGDIRIAQDKPDTHDGFAGANPDAVPEPLRREVAERLAPLFPTGDRRLDRELGRVLGMVGADVPGLVERVVSKWSHNSPVEDDIHLLMVESRLPGARDADLTRRTAFAVAEIQHKMNADKKEPSRFWPSRVADMFARLLQRDSALGAALVASPNFNLPDHAVFAQRLADADKPAAARRLAEARSWTPELVEFLAVLPDDELFPLLRAQWEHANLRDAIALVLARAPHADDRERFVTALASFQPAVVERAAKSLAGISGRVTPAEIAAAVTALRRACSQPREKAARESLTALLGGWAGQSFTVADGGAALKAHAAVFEWFVKAYPREAAQFGGGEDVASFLQRLPAVQWDAGDAERGRRLFEERACQRCHASSTRIGPDLAGVTARLSREDLFIAILDPNRDISPTYLPKLVTTKSGATHTGFMVYDSPTAKLVQTGPDTTVRLTGEEIASVADARVSIMPAGLLAGLKDAGLADLLAFMRTLQKK
jgi:putative membrane-bound dehydrogenase-like protein